LQSTCVGFDAYYVSYKFSVNWLSLVCLNKNDPSTNRSHEIKHLISKQKINYLSNRKKIYKTYDSHDIEVLAG
jgi:hypothetical protein